MAILATDTGGGGDFTPMPSGTHIALCNMVVDLGKQRIASQMYGESVKHQVYIRWETPNERLEWTDKEGADREGPRVIGKTYTLSLHENATLRGDLEKWRGRAFTEEECRGFDVAKLLGVPCMISVTHKDSNGKLYANVAGVMQMPKGTDAPKAENSLLIYDGDNPGSLEYLPEWLQKKINEQVNDAKPAQGGSDFGDDLDDDIPF